MKTILIADDEPFIRRLLAVTLHGFRIVAAEDGVTALDLARRYRPDLMLLDVSMPELSGIEVCATIRAEPSLARTPVVLLTASHWARDEALTAGATAFIEKPFRPMTLLNLVDRLVGNSLETLPQAS